MNEANRRQARASELIREHIANDKAIAKCDARIAALQTEIAVLEGESQEIEARQREIAAELAPALRDLKGAVETWDGIDKCAVRLTPGGSLAVDVLKPMHMLGEAMRPRMFSDAEIAEAAMHAVFSDADDDDCTEVLKLPGRTAFVRSVALGYHPAG